MPDIKSSVLITEQQIQKKIEEMASTLNQKFQGQKPVAIGILKGAFCFYTDLLRSLSIPLLCDFCVAESYGKKTVPSKEVRLILDTEINISEKPVILVEDIVDRGRTLHFMQAYLKNRNPLSLTTVALVAKPENLREKPCQVDLVGFKVTADSFLVGYGLDYQESFRHLPYIAEITNFN